MSVASPTPRVFPRPSWPGRRDLIAIAAALLVIGAIAGAASTSPLSLLTAVAGGAPAWLLAAALLNALSHCASGLVWHRGLGAAGLDRIGLPAAMRAHWICRGASELLPFQLGEAARVVALGKERGADGATWRVVGSIAAFKTVDAAVSMSVAAAVLVVVTEPSPVVALGVIVGATLILGGITVARVGGRLTGRLPGRARTIGRELVAGAAVLRSGGALLSPLAWQVLSTALRLASLAALLIAYGAPADAAPLLFALLVVAGLMPLAPGGAGVREATVVPMLIAVYGLGLETALAVSLAVQAVTLTVALAGAGVAMVSRARVPLPAEPRPVPAPAGV